mmetsp:Transcript_31536/g.40550  ORF Transcript_31536/g.40550 Transcript_31536/m.40550 type:complete len:105 (+) Transcript_31536:265-579(+)
MMLFHHVFCLVDIFGSIWLSHFPPLPIKCCMRKLSLIWMLACCESRQESKIILKLRTCIRTFTSGDEFYHLLDEIADSDYESEPESEEVDSHISSSDPEIKYFF